MMLSKSIFFANGLIFVLANPTGSRIGRELGESRFNNVQVNLDSLNLLEPTPEVNLMELVYVGSSIDLSLLKSSCR
jgi:hypothetical protein